MKNLNITRIYITIISFLILVAFFFGCSENSIMNSATELNPDANPPSTITVEPSWEGNFLSFKVTNNTRDTIINDFHVQFDTTRTVTGWITWPEWIIDQNTTDTAKGKIGVKCGPQGQPILPMGGVAFPVGVRLGYNTPNKQKPIHWYDYTWQATRDGVVVKSGHGNFPPR